MVSTGHPPPHTILRRAKRENSPIRLSLLPPDRQKTDRKKKKKRQADSSDRKRCCRIAGAAARGGKVVVCAVYWPGENCTGIPDFEGKEGNPPTKVAISPNKHIPI